MKLFPHVLIRVGGGPFEKLESLRLRHATQIVGDIYKRKVTVAALKQRLSNALYDVIGSQTDTEVRLTLINLRRDIFNERTLTEDPLDLVSGSLPEDVFLDVKRYVRHNAELSCSLHEGEGIYRNELQTARHHLRGLARAENLQKGLLLSSQSLLKYGIPNYLQEDAESRTKPGRNTEQSLIKYVSRIYAKTSPFSTFTNLALGKMMGNGDNETAEEDMDSVWRVETHDKPAVISHIRLNNYLYKYLLNLLTQNRGIYRGFPIRPNPTLTREGDHYLCLTNSNNIESFQRIPFNPVLEMFQILTSAQREGVVYDNVMRTIIDNQYIDASPEEIETYMNQLIEYGFFEFNIGVSGIDTDWDVKLCQKLKHLCPNVPTLGELLETLAQVRELAQRYGKADVATRQQILSEAYGEVKAIAMKLHEAAGLPAEERLPAEAQKGQQIDREREKESEDKVKSEAEFVFKHQVSTRFSFRPEQLLYEDTVLDCSPELNAEAMTRITGSLRNLFREIRIFERREEERLKMRSHFVQKYGNDGVVSILTFYEDYYREFKKPEAKRQAEAREASEPEPNASEGVDRLATQEGDEGKKAVSHEENSENFLTVPAVEARQMQNQTWLNQFASIVNEGVTDGSEQIDFNLQQLIETNQTLQIRRSSRRNHGSHGIFIQLFHQFKADGQPQLMGVVNGTAAGFGKMMSRFLHLFDDTVTGALREWNQSLDEGVLFIENTDASYFNANLHPPLMPFEVLAPGGHNSLPAKQQIPVTELQVSLDEKADQLQLIHEPTQKRGYVFDLGFQGRGRSKLFQLLDGFTADEIFPVFPLLKGLEKLWRPQGAEKGADQIQIRPRVVYDEQLVLQRKAWFIPKTLLPFREKGESDWAYFVRLNEWRLEHGMPKDVFTYLFNRATLQDMKQDTRKKVGQDDYKPQYICFDNPFLVNLFEKLLTKVPQTLIIEEMLPNPEQLLTIGTNRYVTEFMIQWYEIGEDEN